MFTEHRKRQGCMHGVSERIENGGDIEIDRFVMAPNVGNGQRDIFGESAGPVDAHSERMGAQMSSPGKAVAAAAANHVTFAAHNLSWIKIDHIGADLDYLAHELVSDHHGNRNGLTRPIIPLEDMHVRA